jgi:hypothetical protein
MSADSVVVFYGAEISLSVEDVRACELRSHPLMKSAREVGLDTYWVDFLPHDADGHQLLVGRRFGEFGVEDSVAAHIEKGTVTLTMEKVDAFLARAGISGPGSSLFDSTKLNEPKA